MIITYLPHAKFFRQFAMAHHQKKWESYLTEIKYGGTVFSSVPPYLYSSIFSLPFTYLYFCVFSNNVSVTLSLNSLILSSIPGSFIAAPALFAVSIIQKLPGR